MGIRVGIDLGTTYSAVAMIDAQTGRARVIPNRDGNAVTPSVVAVMPGGEVLFGTEAKEQQELGYTGTAAFFKREMGVDGFSVTLANRACTAVDLSSMLLRGLVAQAEEVSGEHIDGAVVTVPAYFGNAEREATIQAARQAGLNVLGLLNEPTAAAFAYGINGKGVHQTVLVYDLGGGTFDVSLAQVDDEEIRILGSDGDHRLGGKDWDDAVSRWIADQFEEEFGVDLTEDDEMLSRLAVLAENAKKRLSKSAYADITVDFQGNKGKYRLTREEFDDITSFMLGQTSDIVDRLFASLDPPMTWNNVDGAILVGGSTRMKQVSDYIVRMSGKEPLSGVNVDEAVALGAAIRANQDAAGRSQLPLLGGAPRLLGKKNASTVPLLGGRKITDATAYALGMINESEDRERYINNVVIRKNAPVPAEFTRTVEMRVPKSGGHMEVYMLQGSEPAPLDNEVAGKYVFDVPYIGNGTTRIDVTYSYDENAVIGVKAVQQGARKELRMHREPVPDDMSWVLKSPRENEPATSQSATGEVYLFIDLSGSMDGEPIWKAQQAVRDFARQMDLSSITVGVVGFADYQETYGTADDMRKIEKYVQCLKIDGALGYGNRCNPLSNLSQHFHADSDVKIAVFLTDGVWNNQRTPITDAHRAWEQGIDTIGIGFGGADDEFLREISSLKDLSGLTDLSHLSESFSNIARAINTGSGITARQAR